jgi:transposase InsO family protein
MKIKSCLIPGIRKLENRTADISKEAQKRLKWFDYYNSHAHNARLTCRYFGISPQTFYRWKRRYDPQRLRTLEDHPHRPKRVREHTWSSSLEQAVLALREQYPRWGKEKLAVLLSQQGIKVSVSMVGRILAHLKKQGLLREPLPNYISTRKRQRKRPYAIRKPKEYKVKQPGDIVQVDTLDIRPLPGMILKQFTARDIFSRWDVIEVYTRATSHIASLFLDKLQRDSPFTIKAIQVDGGSEFEAAFEEECCRRQIALFVLPPRSPKLNGYVERANRTHTEEFYEVTDSSFDLPNLRSELAHWQTVYNTIRPHQSLKYMTPLEFIQQWEQNKKEVMCH